MWDVSKYFLSVNITSRKDLQACITNRNFVTSVDKLQQMRFREIRRRVARKKEAGKTNDHLVLSSSICCKSVLVRNEQVNVAIDFPLEFELGIR